MPHTIDTIYCDAANNLGVEIADIQAVIGTSDNDIGLLCADKTWDRTQTPAVLVEANRLNKWAKYKPYRSSSFETTDNARRAAKYGLDIVEYTDLGTPSSSSSFLYKLVHGQLGWEYLKPRGIGGGQGGANEWFRFLDFDGYYKDAVCPVGEPVTSVLVTGGTAQIAWDILDNLNGGNLALPDIYIGNAPLSGYYLGILLYKNDNNYRIVTSDNTVGAGNVQITISDFPSSDLGDWMAYPFFSSVRIPYNGQLTTGSYVSAGWDENRIELHFRSSSQSLSFYAWGVWRDNTHTIVDIEWYAYNEASSAMSVQPTLLLVYAGEGVQPAAGSLASQASLGTVNVPAQSGGAPGTANGHTTITRPSHIAFEDYIWWLGISVQGFDTNYEQIEEQASIE